MNRSFSRKIPAAASVLLIIVLLGSCAGFVPNISYKIPAGSSSGPAAQNTLKPLPPLSNNSAVRLGNGIYRGNITIAPNSVTLTGTGVRATIIRGNITITGNNCVLKNLKVEGSVYINGNNADLRGALITGDVRSAGKNNRW